MNTPDFLPPLPCHDEISIPRGTAAMNALIFIIVLLFGNADISPAGVAVVWAFLVVVEWLADRFAGWLAPALVSRLLTTRRS